MRHAPDLIPRIVLLSDARNDAVLERAIRRLPRGSVLVWRHYHLERMARAARLRQVARVAAMCGVRVVVAGIGYGPPGPRRAPLMLATAHDLREVGRAQLMRADAVLLSPVFATRTHLGAKGLGAIKFNLLARQAALPVLALGGVNRARFAQLRAYGFAAIDGLS